MTIQELYDWAIKNNTKDIDVEIQYRDSGGCYEGTEDLCESGIEFKHTKWGDVVVL